MITGKRSNKDLTIELGSIAFYLDEIRQNIIGGGVGIEYCLKCVEHAETVLVKLAKDAGISKLDIAYIRNSINELRQKSNFEGYYRNDDVKM